MRNNVFLTIAALRLACLCLLTLAAGACSSASALIGQLGGARNQSQNTFVCTVDASYNENNGRVNEFYRTDAMQTAADVTTVSAAWRDHFNATYPGRMRPYVRCFYVSLRTTTGWQTYTQIYDDTEASAKVHGAKIIRDSWKYKPDQAEPVPPRSAAPSPSQMSAPVRQLSNGNTVTAKGFMYCYSEPAAGMNTYFSDVFPVDLPAYAHPMGPIPDDASVNQIKEEFYRYLTQKGYKFKPGKSNSEFRPEEQAAKALKHRRAYEGSPCSNCGRTVETGWRYGSTPTAEVNSTEALASQTAIERNPALIGQRSEISGTYSGSYRCAQGSTNLKLTLLGMPEGELTGQFTFDLPPARGARTATYSLSGTYDTNGEFRLDPLRWVSPPPPGYVMVGMEGAYNPSAHQVAGKITNATCSTFEATRDRP